MDTNPVNHMAWQSTRIWIQLCSRTGSTAERCKLLLQKHMPTIETLLAKGGTSPLDFTLHDEEHAFRVAERMVDIVKPEVLQQLSEYELMQALMAAYLHDIGMTPARNRVRQHYSYLVSGDSRGLTNDDLTIFQTWLDTEGGGVEPPLCHGTPTQEELTQADELVTYYCRHRHNDWSEEWIRQNLLPTEIPDYPSWVDDLVTICRSHHQGYHELLHDRFDPHIVGSPAAVVHIRYLCVMLRVADILEFDPERTPEVILQHRDIAPGSRIYWWKDHYVTMAIEDGRVVISARPKSAYLFKAVRTMVGDINRELQVAWNLGAERHYAKCPGLLRDLPHQWCLSPSVVEDIRAHGETFEYIEGSFRPNTRRVLELLSGVELYEDTMAALRELLQNAFDAVKEQIAWERLRQPKPSDPTLATLLGTLHQVVLSLEVTNRGIQLICSDSGVGMNKRIIADHLLVSGQARRHDVLDLSRRCRAAGFRLERTGQFGIGVLSYFMLARRVVIKTRRSVLPGDSEPHGWRFTTEGIGSFGELTPDHSVQTGSEVQLDLRPEVTQDPSAWFQRLRGYLLETLRYIPCRFELRSNLPGVPGLSLGPGWVHDDTLVLNLLLRNSSDRHHRTPIDLMSSQKRDELDRERASLVEAKKEARSMVHWMVDEGELPNDLGRYRILIPYFPLHGGNSLAFLRVQDRGGTLFLDRVGAGYALLPTGKAIMAWKGMKVADPVHKDIAIPHGWNAFVEIDWLSPEVGKLTVNRSGVGLSDRAQDALGWLGVRAQSLYTSFLNANQDSLYGTVNHQCAGGGIPPKDLIYWLSLEDSPKWTPVRFPATTSVSAFDSEKNRLWRLGQPVSILPSLGPDWVDDVFEGVTWHTREALPDRIVLYPSRQFMLVGLWTDPPTRGGSTEWLPTSRFPPELGRMVGATMLNFTAVQVEMTIWNKEHPVVREVTAAAWEWAEEAFRKSRDPLVKRHDLLSDKGRAAAWLLKCITADDHDLWDGLQDRDPEFLPTIWRALFGGEDDVQVMFWHQEMAYSHMDVLTPTGWQKEYTDDSNLKRLYPVQDPEWVLDTRPRRSRQPQKIGASRLADGMQLGQ